jgi:hypothetical protein
MDIVEWLRGVSSEHNMYRCEEAADEIERLRKIAEQERYQEEEKDRVMELLRVLRKAARQMEREGKVS